MLVSGGGWEDIHKQGEGHTTCKVRTGKEPGYIRNGFIFSFAQLFISVHSQSVVSGALRSNYRSINATPCMQLRGIIKASRYRF